MRRNHLNSYSLDPRQEIMVAISVIGRFLMTLAIFSTNTTLAIRMIVTMKRGISLEEFQTHQRWVLRVSPDQSSVHNSTGSFLQNTFNTGNVKGYWGVFSGRDIRAIKSQRNVSDPPVILQAYYCVTSKLFTDVGSLPR